MGVDSIVLAIPVFFALIGVELVVARCQGRSLYRLNDSVNDLSCGILQQLLGVALKTVLFAGYVWVYESHRLLEIPVESAAAWIACFFGVEFFYYWFHRKSHEINVFWAAHVVHHQSEEYNLAVALRQGAFQQGFSWIFYLPLALAGFPPVMFLALSSFNTLYQFWIHTRTIGRLGAFEWVFNTPSNHRVHHARNPKYIDRNHGGTLIIWDRLFGTYVAEEEEPVYGITTPLRSWNPVWANLHYWAELAGKARRTSSLADKIRLFLARPGWHPAELGGYVGPEEVDGASYCKFDTPTSRQRGLYVLVHFALVVTGAAIFLFNASRVEELGGALVSGLVVTSLVTLGGLLEQKRWGVRAETLRVAFAPALLTTFLSGGSANLLGPAALSLGSLAWLRTAGSGADSPTRQPSAAGSARR